MRADRLKAMEQYIMRVGSATLENLAKQFDISINTVRRDLPELIKSGQLKKVYGGISVIEAPQQLIDFGTRSNRNISAKEEIGKAAATLVPDNTTVFLDSGTTTIHVLQHIAKKQNITVISHSLNALYEAAKYPNLRIVALGGFYSPPTASYVGITTINALSLMSIDMVFIAATGVTIEHGLSNTTGFEAEIKRNVVGRSNHIILVADSTKFGRDALFTFCEIPELSAIITDKVLPERYFKFCNQSGVKLICTEDKTTDNPA